MKKKKLRNNDLVLATVHHNDKCPSCKKVKETLIHFLHKNTLKNKRLLELYFCDDCVKSSRQKIIDDKAKDFFYLIPILNSMLEAVGIVPEELTIDQIAELMNDEPKKEESKVIEGELIKTNDSKECTN